MLGAITAMQSSSSGNSRSFSSSRSGSSSSSCSCSSSRSISSALPPDQNSLGASRSKSPVSHSCSTCSVHRSVSQMAVGRSWSTAAPSGTLSRSAPQHARTETRESMPAVKKQRLSTSRSSSVRSSFSRSVSPVDPKFYNHNASFRGGAETKQNVVGLQPFGLHLPKKDAAFQVQQFQLDAEDSSLSTKRRQKTKTRDAMSTSQSWSLSVSLSSSRRRSQKRKRKDDHNEEEQDKEESDPQTTVQNALRKLHNALLYNHLDPSFPNQGPPSRPKPIKLWFDYKKQLPADLIQERRATIKRSILSNLQRHSVSSSAFSSSSSSKLAPLLQQFQVNEQILQWLVQLYDHYFFDRKLLESLNEQHTNLRVGIGLLTFEKNVAALCGTSGDQSTITFHPGVNQHLFDGVNPEMMDGILCYDRLEYVQLVLEHELVHLIIQVCLRKAGESHGAVFQKMARSLFGHLDFKHVIDPKAAKKKTNSQDDEKERKQKKEAGLSLEERLRRVEEQERIKVAYQIGDLVVSASRSSSSSSSSSSSAAGNPEVVGILVLKSKQYITLLRPDGSILEKLPFIGTQLVFPETRPSTSSESKKKAPDKKDASLKQRLSRIPPVSLLPTSVWEQMVQWTRTFLDNKKRISKHDRVWYANEKGEACQGVVLAKKPMCAQIQVAHSLTSLLPYHCISLSQKSSNTDSLKKKTVAKRN